MYLDIIYQVEILEHGVQDKLYIYRLPLCGIFYSPGRDEKQLAVFSVSSGGQWQRGIMEIAKVSQRHQSVYPSPLICIPPVHLNDPPPPKGNTVLQDCFSLLLINSPIS